MEKENESAAQETMVSYQYSSLVDETTQNQIIDILKAKGFDDKTIDWFIKTVKDFNGKQGMTDIASQGFVSINTAAVPYEEDDFVVGWTELELPFAKMSEAELQKFQNIFSPIQASETTDVNKHANTIVKEWEKRKVSFDNDSASWINVFLHYPETENLFIGHSGILVEDGDGYVFIEKLAQAMPFQISKFKTKEELYDVLMERYDVNTGDYAKISSKPIIMENDKLLNR